MRQTLKAARANAGLKQREIAEMLGISTIHYRNIEAGTREGRGAIWDDLEAFFEYKIPQRELRAQVPQNCITEKEHTKEVVT